MAKDDRNGDEIFYTHEPDAVEPESVRHLHCLVDSILRCMDGSDEYCCKQCAAFEMKSWVNEWLEENNGNNS